ncbi:MAG: carbon-nitrogen hydrolase family protein [Pseudonocardia sp.]|nr:carbon-nitrogen hydrolase family protein [Pseudonocardia sp.]
MGEPSSVDVAVIQVALPDGDPEHNRRSLAGVVSSLGPVDLVVAPELFFTGYDLDMIDAEGTRLAEPLDGPSAALTVELAVRHDTTIVVGFLERAEGGVLYDSALVATPDGGLRAYRKSHLYPPEQARFAAGDELFVVSTPAGVLAPQICFEHAFPAIATAQALAGAQVIVIPSAVGSGFEHLLRLRSRARAQDNQVFVVAANLNTPGFCGSSLVADPRGAVLADADGKDAILRVRLDLATIDDERAREPSLTSARPELYHITAAHGLDHSRT